MEQMTLGRVMLPNGEEYGYRQWGYGEEVLLFIHGNLVSSRHWGDFPSFFGKNYKVIALDLRGAGNSSYNNPVESFSDWAYDVKLFCDELGFKVFTLVGWSMGGGVAQRFVSSYPGYAKKLILIEAASCAGVPYHRKGANGEFLEECYDNREKLLKDIQLKPMIDALEMDNRAYMKYLWDNLVFNINKPEEKEYEKLIDDIYLTKNLKDAAWAAHTFNISHLYNGVREGSGEIDKIDIPVLVFAGDKDVIIPVSVSEFTAKEIGKNARLEILKGCGHAPHYDEPEIVREKIVEFVAE